MVGSVKALPWTANLTAALSRRIEARRLSHALMISGPSGVGKLKLTEHVVASLLDMPAPQELADAAQSAPDLMLVVPEEKKTSISIDQIRELGQWMTLSSHGPSGKVAVIVPAESMTIAAANALLSNLHGFCVGGVTVPTSSAWNHRGTALRLLRIITTSCTRQQQPR